MTASGALTPALHRTFRLQWEAVQQRWVLLYPEGMVVLNDSAAAILQRCDGRRTLEQIVEELQTAFARQDLESEIHAFVDHAVQRGWLV